ncbi:hypothetical protein [Pleionea sp. CnH1-48]|uniref:hypothetical protein n=1 Tax=Pleionea sp. CnH1-48 TaxID=2954494 RepID=UPI002096DC82|nr:hypothetical protein [Pleionea sp. CnH1-48]MCO7223319.1 hypothetical protein [Pleionea sp. CnH1-48]
MAKSDKEKGYIKRPEYFERQSIRAKHLTEEQRFQDRVRVMDTQFFTGWGMVCGGGVTHSKKNESWTVTVYEGYGKTPLGNPVLLDGTVEFDIREKAFHCLGQPDACSLDDDYDDDYQEKYLCRGYLVAKYKALEERREAAAPDRCHSHDTDYGISGYCYGVELDFLCEKPYEKTHRECSGKMKRTFQTHRIFPCQQLDFVHPQHPHSDTVILATIYFSRQGIHSIDLVTDRHQLVPYPILLDYVTCMTDAIDELYQGYSPKQPEKKKKSRPLDVYKYDSSKGKKKAVEEFSVLTNPQKKKLKEAELANADAIYKADRDVLIEVLGANKEALVDDLLEEAKEKMKREKELPVFVEAIDVEHHDSVSIDDIEILNEEEKVALEAADIYSMAGAATLSESELVENFAFEETRAKALIDTIRGRVFSPTMG